jgi:hypothetical protein
LPLGAFDFTQRGIHLPILTADVAIEPVVTPTAPRPNRTTGFWNGNVGKKLFSSTSYSIAFVSGLAFLFRFLDLPYSGCAHAGNEQPNATLGASFSAWLPDQAAF